MQFIVFSPRAQRGDTFQTPFFEGNALEESISKASDSFLPALVGFLPFGPDDVGPCGELVSISQITGEDFVQSLTIDQRALSRDREKEKPHCLITDSSRSSVPPSRIRRSYRKVFVQGMVRRRL